MVNNRTWAGLVLEYITYFKMALYTLRQEVEIYTRSQNRANVILNWAGRISSIDFMSWHLTSMWKLNSFVTSVSSEEESAKVAKEGEEMAVGLK